MALFALMIGNRMPCFAGNPSCLARLGMLVFFLAVIPFGAIKAAEADRAWDLFVAGEYEAAARHLGENSADLVRNPAYLKFLLSEAYVRNRQMPFSTEEGMQALASISPVDDTQAINDLLWESRIQYRFSKDDEFIRLLDMASIAKENPKSGYVGLLAVVVNGRFHVEDGGLFKEEVFARFPEFDGMTALQLLALDYENRQDFFSALSLAFHLNRYYLSARNGESERKLEPHLLKIVEGYADRGNFEIFRVLQWLYRGESTTIEADDQKALTYALLGRKAGARTKQRVIDEIRQKLTPSEIATAEAEAEKIFAKMQEEGAPYAAAISWCKATFNNPNRMQICQEHAPFHHLICRKDFPAPYQKHETGRPYEDCRWGYIESSMRPFQRPETRN